MCVLPVACRVEAEGPPLAGTAAEGAVRQAVLAAEAQLAAMMEREAFAAVQGEHALCRASEATSTSCPYAAYGSATRTTSAPFGGTSGC